MGQRLGRRSPYIGDFGGQREQHQNILNITTTTTVQICTCAYFSFVPVSIPPVPLLVGLLCDNSMPLPVVRYPDAALMSSTVCR